MKVEKKKKNLLCVCVCVCVCMRKENGSAIKSEMDVNVAEKGVDSQGM